jgi:spore maturation protein CgeB
MHILHFCPHNGGPMYEWHYVHFIDELARAGHEVTDCNPIQILNRNGSREEYSEILMMMAKQVLTSKGPHMLLAASGQDSILESSAIDHIRHYGMPTVNMCIDGIYELMHVRKNCRHYDLIWAMHLSSMELKNYGANVMYLPMAANPFFLSGNTGSRMHSLCFIGSQYGVRARYISELKRKRVPLLLRGNNWKLQPLMRPRQPLRTSIITAVELMRFSGGRKIVLGGLGERLLRIIGSEEEALVANAANSSGPVSFGEMVSTYSSCSGSLGILEVANTHLLHNPLIQYRLREFEAPMMGCVHFAHRTPELEECFLENKEMIYYSSIEECVDKVSFYLSADRYDLCRSMGEQARNRCVNEHSWLHRFGQLWKQLGISSC